MLRFSPALRDLPFSPALRNVPFRHEQHLTADNAVVYFSQPIIASLYASRSTAHLVATVTNGADLVGQSMWAVQVERADGQTSSYKGIKGDR